MSSRKHFDKSGLGSGDRGELDQPRDSFRVSSFVSNQLFYHANYIKLRRRSSFETKN